MITSDFKERLAWLDSNLVDVSEKSVTLTETSKDGKALLECNLENYCISFKKLDNKKMPFLREQSCADAIIFERLADESWVLHIIEFKRSVDFKEWQKIKKQFCGALLRALAFGGILGISNIKKVKCYTAYCRESFAKTTNPTLLKTANGLRPISVDWLTDNIHLEIINQKVEHKKITLDQEGHGKVTLH